MKPLAHSAFYPSLDGRWISGNGHCHLLWTNIVVGGIVAQQVGHWTCDQEVTGSTFSFMCYPLMSQDFLPEWLKEDIQGETG